MGLGDSGEFKTFHVRVDLTTGAECTLDGNGYLANVNGTFVLLTVNRCRYNMRV